MKKKSSGATFMKTKSSGAGAIFMKRRAPESELCHIYNCSATLFRRGNKTEVTHPKWKGYATKHDFY